MNPSPKLKFGEWIAEHIAGANCKVLRICDVYYNTESVLDAAKEIDRMVCAARLEKRKLSRIENLMFDILIGLAGFKSVLDASKEYEVYISK